MSKTEQELENLLDRLSKANTEEEIFEHLRSLVKGFSPRQYTDLIVQNPYYTAVFDDVRQIVFDDISKMKEAIQEEIDAIDKEVSLEPEAMLKLSTLKKECRLLLEELIVKENEIMAIKI